MSVESQASSERIKLVYRTKINDQDQEIELPFRLLILGNFSSNEQADFFSEQTAVSINNDNFNQVMQSLDIQISINVLDKISSSTEENYLNIKLDFNQLSDFHPSSIINQTPVLSKFIDCRTQLLNLRDNDNLPQLWPDFLANIKDNADIYDFISSFSLQTQQLQPDSIDLIVTEIDECLSLQLDEILHHREFNELESLWRGLLFLIERTDFI